MTRLQNLYPFIALIGLYRFTASFFLAKKSMTQTSPCEFDTASTLLRDEIGLSTSDIDFLQQYGILSTFDQQDGQYTSNGCWMPRRADAIAIIVVDALRFDFALQHLPKSIGAKLTYEGNQMTNSDNVSYDGKENNSNTNSNKNIKDTPTRGQSQLFKFVADPPTVTMQRLKGLTTGGLPTFADISGSFGGANVDEDSWVQQLHNVPISKRGLQSLLFDNTLEKRDRLAQMGFVGDDTWIDLFPHQFDDTHPYPSFNTRDLDTVDNGCLLHLPRLLKTFGPNRKNNEHHFFELLVTHFLGVDHVGHTYGPHNTHMDKKLNQIDDALKTIFATIDDATDQCHVAFVFGDHGMTEDGNHGGGTEDETNAGLFAYYSPGCGDLGPSLDITGSEIGSYSQEAFRSINQIDLVPTISFLLGLPIPFANLGGVVPSLLPPLQYKTNGTIVEAPYIATSLALNAAQVWNYLTTYSTTANKLPDGAISDLDEILQSASSRLKDAIAQKDGFDSIAYREACGLFKYFLSQAIDLGKQVWTRFDTTGMVIGIMCLVLSLYLSIPGTLYSSVFCAIFKRTRPTLLSAIDRIISRVMTIEGLIVFVAIIFQCIVVTFSNSYIISEEFIIMFTLSMLCMITSVHHIIKHIGFKRFGDMKQSYVVMTPMIIVLCSRVHQLIVTGHGQDPIIRTHWVHHAFVFNTSLLVLAFMRTYYHFKNCFGLQSSFMHTIMDIITMLMLSHSWMEKRSLDIARHGYLTSKIAIILSTIGFVILITKSSKYRLTSIQVQPLFDSYLHKTVLIMMKVMLFIITVTGPSAAASCVLLVCQFVALSKISFAKGSQMVCTQIIIHYYSD